MLYFRLNNYALKISHSILLQQFLNLENENFFFSIKEDIPAKFPHDFFHLFNYLLFIYMYLLIFLLSQHRFFVFLFLNLYFFFFLKCGAFIIIDDLISIHYYQHKSIVYIKVHSVLSVLWVWTNG